MFRTLHSCLFKETDLNSDLLSAASFLSGKITSLNIVGYSTRLTLSTNRIARSALTGEDAPVSGLLMLFAGRGIRLSTKMNSSGDNFSQNKSSGMSSGCETWQLELDNLEVYSKNFKSLER